MAVKTRIIKIGNSQGIRIPKPLLDQTGLAGEVHLQVEQNRIVIQPADHPRCAWDQAFADMAKNGDDILLDPADIQSEWDEKEWEWPAP